MQKREKYYYLKKVSQGTILTLLLTGTVMAGGQGVLKEEFFLSETVPGYSVSFRPDMEYKTLEDEEPPAAVTVFENYPSERLKPEVVDRLEISQELIGLTNVIYQEESDTIDISEYYNLYNITLADIEQYRDIENLKSKFYTVDRNTSVTEADKDLFDVDKFLSADLSLDLGGEGAKVLIFHTHAYEAYVGSSEDNLYDGVVGLGEELMNILEEDYGIPVIHDTSRYDIVDGKVQIGGAYERMEVNVQKILEENPSIEIIIDLHRDGVADETVKLMKTIDGRDMAQIMFVNGLSKLNQEGGGAAPIEGLENENLAANLAFSFNMQLRANELYPGLTRKVYLNPYRYSLHMRPKSLLVEVGAQTNTKEEAFNSMRPLAAVLASVVLNEQAEIPSEEGITP